MEATRPLNESLICRPGNGSAGGAWNGTGAGCDAPRRPARGPRGPVGGPPLPTDGAPARLPARRARSEPRTERGSPSRGRGLPSCSRGSSSPGRLGAEPQRGAVLPAAGEARSKPGCRRPGGGASLVLVGRQGLLALLSRAALTAGAPPPRLSTGLARRKGSWQAAACCSLPRAWRATFCGSGWPLQRWEHEQEKGDLDLTVRILLYSAIFLLSILGNALVIVVLAVNKRLRTVTNSFLLSLALSDLMVAAFCMPFTFIPNLMRTFVFGKAVCKTMAYLMGMSVSVSTFSLVAIAIERYNAICNPLQSRVWQTRSHACRVIAVTWLLSALLMLPYPVYSTTVSLPSQPGISQCSHKWPGSQVKQAWYLLLLITLFLVPGLVMVVAYGLISRELYRGIQFEMDLTRETKAQQNGRGTEGRGAGGEGDGCYIQVPRGAVELSVLTPAEDSARQEQSRINSSDAKLLAKRRVIRMLVVVVVMFFVCWLPLYVANTWRAFDAAAAHRALSGTPISFIHLLSYTSACVNPFVYCFMNKRFRKAFASTFACCLACCRRHPHPPDDEVTATGASLSKFSYTTVSSIGPP
ncbi:gastrin/cholecystokinin type B receptor [Tiliqua scincoides]|uniref:gastrin/cholecystokinin type B receptor n=1 Tax=Tiliqua scincoides TaxID=71010 RepID=UPI0034629EED